MKTTLQALAKINLTLEILGKRPDGYHDLELIFQPVSLADELSIEDNKTDRLEFSCSVREFENASNLVCRGYEAMRASFPGQIPGLTIHLEKHIPSGAGMGGGSTDCSALLVWLNQTYGLGLDREGLIALGARLGADVPACMIPHATLGLGIGEKLTDIRTGLALPLLILKPDWSFSTGEMYGRSDALPYTPDRRKAAAMRQALEQGSGVDVAAGLFNRFEEVVPEREGILNLCRSLLEAGALGACMTGSGSAVFGIFPDSTARDLAFVKLRNLPGCRCYPAETVNRYEDGSQPSP